MDTTTGYILSTTLLWALLAVIFGVWVVTSWVLTYHWKTYAKDNRAVSKTLRTYYIVSVCVFIITGILIATI